MPQIKNFKGLNNVTDPLRLGMEWLAKADNVVVTDTGAVTKREGYTKVLSGSYTSAYSTLDFSRTYFVTNGSIVTFDGAAVAALKSAGEMSWAEINDQVFFTNGVDAGIILPNNTVLPWTWPVPGTPTVSGQEMQSSAANLPAGLYRAKCTYVMPDGRETGTSDTAEADLVVTNNAREVYQRTDRNGGFNQPVKATQGFVVRVSNIPSVPGLKTRVYLAAGGGDSFRLIGEVDDGRASLGVSYEHQVLGGVELTTGFLDPLPQGVSVIQAWGGRLHAALYDPTLGQSAVFSSEAMGFHLFDLNDSFFMVPGQILMMAPTKDALIIGTNSRIYSYSGDRLEQLAPYGVVPGQHWDKDGEEIFFWTTRGVCSALPFKNLTEAQVSVAPGVRAGGAIVRRGGQKRYVVSLQQGGAAFNNFS